MLPICVSFDDLAGTIQCGSATCGPVLNLRLNLKIPIGALAELMLEFQKVHEQDTAAAQDPSPTVEATTGKPDTQVASKPKNARRYGKQKKKQDEKEETYERGKTSLITESHDSQDETDNMQESAENDESRRWRSRWDIERPTTPEMRDNGWMVRRVVQARETELDGTPSEPPTERLFPCVPPEYRSRLEESKPRSARPGIVNRSLTLTKVHESGALVRSRAL